MSSMTPLEKVAQRSHHLLPVVAIALIGCLGGCEYEPDGVSLPSASFPAAEPTTESSSMSATPVPSISRYHGPPGTGALSEEEACAEMKAIAEFIWWTEVHETPDELRTMLEDLFRLSARAPDSIKQGIADYAEGNLHPESRYWREKGGETWPILVDTCRLLDTPTPSPVAAAK
jgi:hypothetical protein